MAGVKCLCAQVEEVDFESKGFRLLCNGISFSRQFGNRLGREFVAMADSYIEITLARVGGGTAAPHEVQRKNIDRAGGTAFELERPGQTSCSIKRGISRRVLGQPKGHRLSREAGQHRVVGVKQ